MVVLHHLDGIFNRPELWLWKRFGRRRINHLANEWKEDEFFLFHVYCEFTSGNLKQLGDFEQLGMALTMNTAKFFEVGLDHRDLFIDITMVFLLNVVCQQVKRPRLVIMSTLR